MLYKRRGIPSSYEGKTSGTRLKFVHILVCWKNPANIWPKMWWNNTPIDFLADVADSWHHDISLNKLRNTARLFRSIFQEIWSPSKIIIWKPLIYRLSNFYLGLETCLCDECSYNVTRILRWFPSIPNEIQQIRYRIQWARKGSSHLGIAYSVLVDKDIELGSAMSAFFLLHGEAVEWRWKLVILIYHLAWLESLGLT